VGYLINTFITLDGLPMKQRQSAKENHRMIDRTIRKTNADKKVIATITILILMGITAVVIVFLGNNLYVSPDGSDRYGCTFFTPCQTFARAESVAAPGDEIHISGYLGEMKITKSGTENAHLTITGDEVILSGLIVEGDYVDVYKVEVTGSISHGILVKSKHVLIEGSIVHNSVIENGINGVCALLDSGFGSAFKAQLGAQDVTFRGNFAYNNCGEGFAITRTAGAVIEDNTIGSNYSVGIYVDNSYNIIVQNNTVTCDDTYMRDGHRMTGLVFAAEFYSGWGMQLHDNSFLNNTVTGCYDNIASWLSKVDGTSTNLTIDSNVSRGSTHRSIAVYSQNQNVVVSNNILDRPAHIVNSDGVIMNNNQLVNSGP